MNILILFAHPAFQKSRVNKVMVDGITHIEGVTFHDLYEEYPELDIDIKREQQLLADHDAIVFQFPLFWYSTPAILKEWQDLVLEHGWAFGSKGNALKGKLFFCSVTTGGPGTAYQEGSFHNHTINQLLAPLKQTAILCKMIPLPPFVVHGTHAIELDEILDHKNQYFKLLQHISKGGTKVDRASKFDYLNDYLKKETQ
jgi:glutathione-regulated potassium-efflux system ancillary protein KefG